MIHVFLGLSVLNTLLFMGAAVLGYLARNGALAQSTHMQVGLFVALFTCLTHSIVFIYFLGTGKSIKTACEEHHIDGPFVRQTKILKLRIFPFAMFGAISIMAAAHTGAAVTTAMLPLLSHRIVALAVCLGNMVCFVFEYHYISANMKLLEQLVPFLPKESEAHTS